MRTLLLALSLAAAAPALAQPDAAREPSDLAQIEAVLGLYFRGHETGRGTYFQQAFHPDARMVSVGDDGAVRETALRTWWERPDGRPADDEADRRRRVVRIEVSGTVAAATLELDYPGVVLHDHMTLLKSDGRWQIVTKAFAAMPKR
ncbi:nuclear transport factor 2 family protein [Rubrivirga sp.]|uniref:nuclear transport factor 2 family protein n=1 Tax=Rubrivirga sp. TaxID=1885344 RepID=UPI003B517A8F